MAEQTTAPVEEKQTNCPACNKVLKRVRRYYRNGKQYCTKRCWIKATNPKPTEEEQK